MATHSNGIAALQLQNQLGIGSYRSAWLLAAIGSCAGARHGRSRARPVVGPHRGRRDRAGFRTKNDPVAGGAGRSHDGKLLVVGAVRSATATIRAACAWPRSRPTAPKASTASSATTSPPPAPPRPTAGPATPGPRRDPLVATIPTNNASSVPWPSHLVLPWPIRCSPISRAGRGGVYHGLRAKHLAISTSSCSASARRRTPPRRLPLRCVIPSPGHNLCTKPVHLQHVGKLVHKRFRNKMNEMLSMN